MLYVPTTPNPKKRLYDMTKEELRSECKKVGKKVGGLKDELLDRLKEPTIKNNRGWEWRHNQQCSGDEIYLAQGEHRWVYKSHYTRGPRKGEDCVTKYFKTGSVFEDKFFDADIKGVRKAADLLKSFTTFMLGEVEAVPRIYLNLPEVWTGEGTGKKLLVEPFISGRYQKFNSNTGWSDNDHPVMAALSHYSWHFSGGRYLLCDLQGSSDGDRYVLTDPVVISVTEEFGCTDGGQKAIDNFFANHRCGRFCKAQWGKPASAQHHFPVRQGTSFFFRR